MSLLSLPSEILIIIIKFLDTKSVYSLYYTCSYLRDIICMHGVVKNCTLSLSSLASKDIFKTMFFKDVSSSLQVLNLSGIQNVSKIHLIQALKKLNLHTLDATYTNITLIDMIEVYSACTSIKRIAMNMVLYETRVAQTKLKEIQNIFKNFEYIHFTIGYCDLQVSTPLFFVHPNLNILVLTISRVKTSPTLILANSNTLKCDRVTINFPNWGHKCIPSNYPTIMLSGININLNEYEFVILNVCNFNDYVVYCTSLFKDFFLENFGIDAKIDFDDLSVNMDSISLFWSTKTKFDEAFFSNLYKYLCKYFPKNYECRNDNKRYFSNSFLLKVFKCQSATDEPLFKKKRMACESYLLDYDDLLKHNNKIQLSLQINSLKSPINILPDYKYLKELTSLSVSGTVPVYYSSNFFKTLFESCTQLETLNIESHYVPLPTLFVKHLPLSHSIKNLRLVNKGINFNNLFLALSLCKQLENVIIVSSSHISAKNDPSVVFKECNNLYYFSVCASMNESTKKNLNKACKTAKNKYKMDYLVAKFEENRIDGYDSTNHYDSCVGVFNLSLIKPQ